MNAKGFTLVELMLSLAILGVLAGLSLPAYLSYVNRNELGLNTENLASMLRRAQTYSRGMNGDSAWGVAVRPGSVTLFKGTAYVSRDTTYDESISLSSNTSISGLSEIYFSKLSALPNTSGSFNLSSSNEIRTVSINAKGMVSY